MRSLFSICLLLIAGCETVTGQPGILKGYLFDTVAKQPVGSATISLLQQKDSSLVSFSMSDDKGRFELTNVRRGDYVLLITHVNYHPVHRSLRIDEKKSGEDVGLIAMNDLTTVLSEVIISNAAPPVTLIGDTIQYNAGSFRVPPNASVEELLKKMPGVKVDKDGVIKAQGEKVTRVLVDGKEFFGNDPKIATKNLPADLVEKVQVYNKQTDQAQLTGFDDGNSETTINLKLRKDRKKGYFGKVAAGAGTGERYQGRLNINSFKKARQLSAIAAANNTNSEGFSIMDMLNFTGELGRMMKGAGGGGNININISNDEQNSSIAGLTGNNYGINTIWGGGLNYNNVIGQKTDLTSNYFYSRFNPVSTGSTQRHYFLPDSSYDYYQRAHTDRNNISHRLNLSADYQIDSLTSIKISPSFGYQQTSSATAADYETISGLSKSNEGTSNNQSTSEGFNFRTDILFRKKFRRTGRTFSVNIQTTMNNGTGNGQLNAINNFYNRTGNIVRDDTINQRNSNNNTLNGYTARIVYTEPLFKHSLMEFSFANSRTTGVTEKITNDFNKQSGEYDYFNALLSNNYMNSYTYNNGGFRIRRQAKKYNYSLGLTAQNAGLRGTIVQSGKDSLISKRFVNLLTNGRFQYYFSKFRNLQVIYTTSTNQPTATQLQPVADNADPLNIKEGNPDLKQEYTRIIQTNLFLVSPYRNRNLFAFLSLQQTDNRIVNFDRIDSFGIKTTRPVNVNGTYVISGDVNWSFPVHVLRSTVSAGSNLNYYKSKQFINGVENQISTASLGPEIRLDADVNDHIQVSLSGRINYNRSAYSLMAAFNTTYFTQVYETGVNCKLPARLFVSSDFLYTINSQRTAGFNSRVPLWNMSLSRELLKFSRGEIKLSVNDLLNKNIGVNRSANQNYIEDSRMTTLRRFFLLTFTYSLNKTAATSQGSGGGLRIITR